MSNHPPFPSILRGVLACAIALFVSACATLTADASKARVQQLENAHLAFIASHTATAAPAQWNQAAFDTEVANITAQFTQAQAAQPAGAPQWKQFIKNSGDLFQRDASLVGKNHFLSPGYAGARKTQLQQNYNLFLRP